MGRLGADLIFVYGGSFDPPHRGHVLLLESILGRMKANDSLYIVPNHNSPLKETKLLENGLIWKFCQWTFEKILGPNINLVDWELKKEEKSYTIDTIEDILNKNPSSEIGLILGEDNLADFHKWHRVSSLVALIKSFLIFRRTTPTPKPIQDIPLFLSTKVEIMNNSLWNVSSTEIRKGFFSDTDVDVRVLNELEALGIYPRS